MISCKNCHTNFEGKYCNHCGQPADTNKIDHKYIGKELQKTFIRLDSGFLFTTKNLLKNPGKTIEQFIEGKRIHHMRPFTYLIIISGIYLILYNKLQLHLFNIEIEGKETTLHSKLLVDYYTQIQFFLLLLSTLFSMLVFGIKKYNFYEYIVVHSYLTSQRILFASISLIVIYFIKDNHVINYVNNFVYLIGVAFMAWAFLYLFKEMSRWKTILKIVLIQVLLYISMALLLAVFIEQL